MYQATAWAVDIRDQQERNGYHHGQNEKENRIGLAW